MNRKYDWAEEEATKVIEKMMAWYTLSTDKSNTFEEFMKHFSGVIRSAEEKGYKRGLTNEQR